MSAHGVSGLLTQPFEIPALPLFDSVRSLHFRRLCRELDEGWRVVEESAVVGQAVGHARTHPEDGDGSAHLVRDLQWVLADADFEISLLPPLVSYRQCGFGFFEVNDAGHE